MRRVIIDVDEGEDGRLNLQEFKRALSKFMNSSLLDHLDSLFAAVDRDSNGQLDLFELAPILFPQAGKKDLDKIHEYLCYRPVQAEEEDVAPEVRADKIDQLRALFALYDKDGSGTVSLDELKAAFSSVQTLYGSKAPEVGEEEAMEAELKGNPSWQCVWHVTGVCRASQAC